MKKQILSMVWFLIGMMLLLSSCTHRDSETENGSFSYRLRAIDLVQQTEDGDWIRYSPVSAWNRDTIFLRAYQEFHVLNPDGSYRRTAKGTPETLLFRTDTEQLVPISSQKEAEASPELEALREQNLISESMLRALLESYTAIWNMAVSSKSDLAVITEQTMQRDDQSVSEVPCLVVTDANGVQRVCLPMDEFCEGSTTNAALCYSTEDVLYVASSKTLYCLCSDNRLTALASVPEHVRDTAQPSLAQTADGGVYFYYQTAEGDPICRKYDKTAQTLEEPMQLPFLQRDTIGLITAPGYDLYDYDSLGIYGYDFGMETHVMLTDWMSVGLSGASVKGVYVCSEKKIYIYVIEDRTGDAALFALEQVSKQDVMPKKEIVIACSEELNRTHKQRLETAAARFNRTSSAYSVRISYVSDNGSAADSLEEQIARSMATGEQIDLILCGFMISADYFINLDLLDDWYPLMEQDAVYSKDAFLPCVLTPFTCTDGTLPVLTTDYSIAALVGKTENLAPLQSWSFAECRAWIKQLPDGISAIRLSGVGDFLTAQSFFTACLPTVLDQYVDMKTGVCQFDCDSFRSLLSLCEEVPVDKNILKGYTISTAAEQDRTIYDPDDTVMLLKQTMDLCINGYTTVGSIEDVIHIRNFYFGGKDVTWIGYPQPESSEKEQGYAISPYLQFALTKTSDVQEGAWEFMKMYLDIQGDIRENLNFTAMTPQIPCTYAGLDQYLEEAGYHTYSVLGSAVIRDHGGSCVSVTEEDKEALRFLLEHTTQKFSNNSTVMRMIWEETSYYFNGMQSMDETVKRIQNRVGLYVSEKHG